MVTLNYFSWDGSLSTVTMVWPGWLRIWNSIPNRTRDIFTSVQCQGCLWVSSSNLSNWCWRLFPQGRASNLFEGACLTQSRTKVKNSQSCHIVCITKTVPEQPTSHEDYNNCGIPTVAYIFENLFPLKISGLYQVSCPSYRITCPQYTLLLITVN